MFRITEKTAHIVKLQDYVDNQGEKEVGLSVKLSMSFGPEVLDMFDPALKAALYKQHDTISAQKPGAEPKGWVRRFDAIERIT